MPSLVFIIMYIAGVLLAFTKQSILPSVDIPAIPRFLLFMKIGRGITFIHILVFQIINISFFITMVHLTITESASYVVLIYNIYIRTSVILLAAILLIAAADAHIMEKRGSVKNNEDN